MMRVISGTAKGRSLKPAGQATRPITDRAKTSLFNILGTHVVDADVLDLFAGAGSVGIETLSRGARAATFVELDRAALSAIRANLESTQLLDRATIVRLDVFKYIRRASVIASGEAASPRERGAQSPTNELRLARSTARFDLIYIAPPQYHGLWAEALATVDGTNLLAENGIVVAQIHPKEYKELALTQLELFDQRKYGSTMLCFYRGKTNSDG